MRFERPFILLLLQTHVNKGKNRNPKDKKYKESCVGCYCDDLVRDAGGGAGVNAGGAGCGCGGHGAALVLVFGDWKNLRQPGLT